MLFLFYAADHPSGTAPKGGGASSYHAAATWSENCRAKLPFVTCPCFFGFFFSRSAVAFFDYFSCASATNVAGSGEVSKSLISLGQEDEAGGGMR